MSLIKKYWVAIALVLFGAAVASDESIIPPMRGLVLGIIAWGFLSEVLATRFGYLKVAELLRNGILSTRRLVVVGFVAIVATPIFGVIWWITTKAFNDPGNAAIWSFVFGFGSSTVLAIGILMGAVTKIKSIKE